jgi:hypothetical protein
VTGALEIAKDDMRSARSVARRVVLLGASNLTKGIGTVVETAERAWGRPLETLAALGHGRSYGRTSTALGRQLPGILECGLWQDLGSVPRVATAALVTDIGNDLLYEEPVERIAGWVEQCLDRLAAVQARTVVTLLPLETLATISRARYRLLTTIFFPSSRISLAEVTSRAHLLDAHVRRLAAQRGFDTAGHRAAWYGFDPIHIRFRQRPLAWREILAPWSQSLEVVAPARCSLARTLYLRSLAPHHRRVLGFEQRRRQPVARLRDGSTLAIY